MGFYQEFYRILHKEGNKSMKLSKRVKIVAVCLSAASALAAFGIVLASEYSTEDPLISKSYLDKVFYPQVTEYVDTKVQSAIDSLSTTPTVPEQTEAPTQTEAPEQTDSPVQTEEPTAQAGNAYEIVALSQGQTLYAGGTLELILRSGVVEVVLAEGLSNGIANLSTGNEMMNGDQVPLNNYCILPRADGRGVKCVNDTAYVMVRGSYEIK